MHSKLKKSLAFSLIELLVALIVVAIISSFLIPTITKNNKDKKISVLLPPTSSSSVSVRCSKISPNCKFCSKNKCLHCSNICAKGKSLNDKCECVSCGEIASHCVACNQGVCLACEGGYGFNADAHSCLPCPAGSYSDGSMPCKPCKEGYYQPYAQQTICIPCPIDKYSNKKGATACMTCPSGTYQNAKGKQYCEECDKLFPNCKTCTSSLCTSCEAGYSLLSSNQLGCIKTPCQRNVANCTEYSSPNEDCKCIGCAWGYKILNNVCVQSSPDSKACDCSFCYKCATNLQIACVKECYTNCENGRNPLTNRSSVYKCQ